MVIDIRVLLYLIGFTLSVVSSVYIIMYLNYLSVDYSFTYYIKFIGTKIECLIILVGLTLINLSIFMKGEKNVLCL